MKDLSEKVAVVTGAAGGIGFALTERLLEHGMKVVMADVDPERVVVAARRLEASGEVLAVATDVSDRRSVQRLADQTVQHFGGVHLLCNNAGIGRLERFESTSLAAWEQTIAVNLWGAVHGCHVFLPILELQREAHIVNTASLAGMAYNRFNHPYNAAKAGVIALSEGLWREFEAEKPNVGVSVLCPAFTRTGIIDSSALTLARDQIDDPVLHAARSSEREMIDAGGDPVDVAECIIAGVKERRLYLFPHPQFLPKLEQRMQGILAEGNPPAL
jgi:NAD(P)-dependent dehydrogenase (short-subunit alcohol dehydrogenase family)